MEGRCGNMDGAITATVPATEIPTQEGESNFGTGYTYQIGPDGTIEIPMRLDGAADPPVDRLSKRILQIRSTPKRAGFPARFLRLAPPGAVW